MPGPKEEAAQTAVPFNFSRAGMVAADQLRTLRTMDEQFARNLTHTLGAWLRINLSVVPQAPEQLLYGQFAEKTLTGFHVIPLRVDPLHARGALACDLTLAPAIIDLLLGGSGRASALNRELTEIEDSVLMSIMDMVLREWNGVWQPYALQVQPGVRERGGEQQRLMPLQERVFSSRFTMTIAEAAGEIAFCMPSSAVTSTLRSFSQRREGTRGRSGEERAGMARRLGGAHVYATMHFPPMKMRATDLRSMAPGSVLPLPLSRGVTAEVCVGGVPAFRAHPVRSEGHRAAQITSTMHETLVAGATGGGHEG